MAFAAGMGIVPPGAAVSAPASFQAAPAFGVPGPVVLTGFDLSQGTQKAFVTAFDLATGEGDLASYPVDSTGNIDKAARIWSADAVLRASQACYAGSASGSLSHFDTGRRIVTRNGMVNVPFRWTAAPSPMTLSSAQLASIGTAGTGPRLVDFLRGDRSEEKLLGSAAGDGQGTIECGARPPSTGLFPPRSSLLGPIVHSRAVYVGAPPADYRFDNYPAYKREHSNRAGRVYVGANDGMVHAFRADTGVEEWAYIPSMLIGQLRKLGAYSDSPTYFVDGGQAAADVNFGSAKVPDWRTVVVGGLGAGGKGLYAIDATNPVAANETAAAAKILWEITPATPGYAELGLTYGTPLIVRLNTGQWAAIVGNGYGNSVSGHAVLYIIDIKDGRLIRALNTGAGTVNSPNGMSSPTALDMNSDGLVDRVYAGDIDGSVWTFDVSAKTASAWSAPAAPLYSSGQPVFGAPDVAAHPIAGTMVYFSNGQPFASSDPKDAKEATVRNYVYGIWEGAPAANAAILTQALTKPQSTQALRVSSALAVNWTDASDPASRPLHRGWRVALPAGERSVGTGFIRDGRYQLTSVSPPAATKPQSKGETWLYELDYESGGVAGRLIFDLNADKLLTDADRALDSSGMPISGPGGIPVGVLLGGGLWSQPTLGTVSRHFSRPLFNGGTKSKGAAAPASGFLQSRGPGRVGRISWRDASVQ